MSSFQYIFYLDYTEVSEPIGWDESAKKIKRSDIYKGLFVEYVNELTFHSDGYEYILDKLNTDGFCANITIQILKRQSEFKNWEVYFRGKVNLQDAEFDVEKCVVKANLEDETLTGLITRLGDTKVPFDSTKTITGVTLAAINETIDLHDTTTAIYTTSRSIYDVNKAFQYILDFISDKNIDFVSDFFGSDVILNSTNTITFTNPTVDLVNTHPVSNLVVKYKNCFNETITLTVPKQATVAGTLNYLISLANYNASGTGEEKFYAQDYRYINKATTNGTNTVTFEVHLPDYEMISITGANANKGAFTVCETGMSKLFFGCGNQIRVANTEVPNVSFKELFDEMDSLFDLGMSLELVSGTPTLRIEPIEYFFSSSFGNLNTAATFTNVNNLKFKQAKEFSLDTIGVGDGSDNSGTVGNQNGKSDWISASLCSGEKKSIKGNWITDSAELIEQLNSTEDKKDDKIFLIQCNSSNDSIAHENRIYSTTTGTNTKYYAYNAYLTNYWRIVNWLFNIKGNPKFKEYVISNEKSVKFERLYSFEYAISETILNNIINNKEQFIVFDSDGINKKIGWIKEISTKNKNGISTINLLTQ